MCHHTQVQFSKTDFHNVLSGEKTILWLYECQIYLQRDRQNKGVQHSHPIPLGISLASPVLPLDCHSPPGSKRHHSLEKQLLKSHAHLNGFLLNPHLCFSSWYLVPLAFFGCSTQTLCQTWATPGNSPGVQKVCLTEALSSQTSCLPDSGCLQYHKMPSQGVLLLLVCLGNKGNVAVVSKTT